MKNISKRSLSKGTPAPGKAKKSSKTMKIRADKPKAPIKSRRAAKKMTKFLELEDGNRESMDSGFGESQPRVIHRYPTRARILAAQATQNNNRNETKSSNAKPAQPKINNNPPDVDKDNDGSAANGPQPRQGTSFNKKRLSRLSVNRLGSHNLATFEELNSTEERLSECSSADWIDHIRWLQPRRDVGLWIECTRKGCGKWRYAENYHDPLDVPKIWFCEMNTDARFADCSIPQQETPAAESPWYIQNAYNAGSIVWAKVNGFPWWPAMVDDCPELLKYWEIRGSSIVPYKYHVKFFNEMKIAWIPVRNLKSYVKNPRSTFIKKTVFWRRDYSQELDCACEVANQALPLSLLERLQKFSWAAQISSGGRKKDEGLAPDAGPAKKKKSTKKSTVDPKILPRAAENAVAPSPVSSATRKQPAKKNVTKNLKENVSKKQTINVRSRIINVETDSAINTRPSTPKLTGVPIRSAISWDGASFIERNKLLEGNSRDRNEADNSNIDDGAAPNPTSNSTQSTHEERTPDEEWYNPRCTKRVMIADIAALAKEIRDSRQSGYAKKATNFRAATQMATTSSPSIALNSRELSPRVQSDEKLDRSSVNLRSSVDASAYIGPTISDSEDRGRLSPNDIAPSTPRTEAFAGTEEPIASAWEPMEIDLSDSTTDFEGYSDRRESPEYPNHAETRDNSQPSNPIFASTSNGLGPSNVATSFSSLESSGSPALSSQPEWDEIADRCLRSCGLCSLSVDFETSNSSVDTAACIEPTFSSREDRETFFTNDILVAGTSRTWSEVHHSQSVSRKSEEASFFRINSASFGEGSGRCGGGSETNFSAGGSEINFRADRCETNFPAGVSETNFSAGEDDSSLSSREPIVIDLTDNSRDFEGHIDQREYSDYPNHAEMSPDSQWFDRAPNIARRFSSFDPFKSFRSIAQSSQPEWDETSELRPKNSGWCSSSADLEVNGPSVSANALPEQENLGRPNQAASWHSREPSRSKSISNTSELAMLNILTRSSSCESSRSSGTVVPSSQPDTDRAWEQSPRFPGLCNSFRDSSVSKRPLSKRRPKYSGCCESSVYHEVSDPTISLNALPEQDYSGCPNQAALYSSHEPASSKYISNMNGLSMLNILTRSSPCKSSRSSGTVVPSSQPETDRAWERHPRFPGLCDRISYLSLWTYSSSDDIDFGARAHSSSDCLFEVITIDD